MNEKFYKSNNIAKSFPKKKKKKKWCIYLLVNKINKHQYHTEIIEVEPSATIINKFLQIHPIGLNLNFHKLTHFIK